VGQGAGAAGKTRDTPGASQRAAGEDGAEGTTGKKTCAGKTSTGRCWEMDGEKQGAAGLLADRSWRRKPQSKRRRARRQGSCVGLAESEQGGKGSGRAHRGAIHGGAQQDVTRAGLDGRTANPPPTGARRARGTLREKRDCSRASSGRHGATAREQEGARGKAEDCREERRGAARATMGELEERRRWGRSAVREKQRK
jgi:hypothetical protein